VEKNKKKLLIVADYFLPHWTGISKAVAYLIEGINEYYDITLLTVRFKKELRKEETILNAKIIREDPIFTISRSNYSVNLVFKFFSLAKNADSVMIHSPSANILFTTVIAKLLGKKVTIFHHGDLILPKGITNFVIMVIFDVFTMSSFFMADTVSTYTDDYAENSRTMKYFLKKFKPMIFPFNLKINSEQKRLDELTALQKKGYTVFGFAGRFVEEKGFDILLNSIGLLKQKRKDKVVFAYAGETSIPYENFYGKNTAKIKELSSMLIFLGLLNKDQMAAFYRSINYIIIPSRSDCFPLVQVEAMIFGVPSIVSDIPGARYLVNQTGFGVIFKKEDYMDLANKIEYITGGKEKFASGEGKVKKILNNLENVEKIRKIIG
jgi:glycosyltransferase involved in cell wall biosynthesis